MVLEGLLPDAGLIFHLTLQEIADRVHARDRGPVAVQKYIFWLVYINLTRIRTCNKRYKYLHAYIQHASLISHQNNPKCYLEIFFPGPWGESSWCRDGMSWSSKRCNTEFQNRWNYFPSDHTIFFKLFHFSFPCRFPLRLNTNPTLKKTPSRSVAPPAAREYTQVPQGLYLTWSRLARFRR